MAAKETPNPQRLKSWPKKPKQDKAAEVGVRHVPDGGVVAVPVPEVEVPAPVVVAQETGDERRARQRGEVDDSGPFFDPEAVATTEAVEG